MDNILIYYVYLNMVDFHLNQIIYFLVIMLIVVNNHLKQFVYYLLIKFEKKIIKDFNFYKEFFFR